MQLAAFRSIQSADGTNLTHNFRPVQPLDGRTVYRNIVGAEPSTISPVSKQTPSTASVPASSPKKPETKNNDVTESPMDNNKNGENSASSMWPVTRVYLFYLELEVFLMVFFNVNKSVEENNFYELIIEINDMTYINFKKVI